MPETQEIPQDRWAAYLDALSCDEQAHPVRIQLTDGEIGEQTLAESVPLVGLTYEAPTGHRPSIAVRVGYGSGLMTHTIEAPSHVYALEGPDGELTCLDIESEAQIKTLIFFDRLESLPPLPGVEPAS